jgi:hypothetical protein
VKDTPLSWATAAEGNVSQTHMWRIDTLERIAVELDFSSSGGSRHASTAIHAGDVRLINALDLVEFDPGGTQVQVCSYCGISHCEPGNWAVLRRLGEFVVWVPAFAQMEAGDWERQEYSPPGFMASLGAPCFSPAAWQQLRASRQGVPDLSELPPLSSHEAVRALQWSAPRRVLGTYPAKPQLHREALVAVTDGVLEHEVRAVNDALSWFFDSQGPIQILPSSGIVSHIEFWLELPGVPAWRAFGRADTGVVMVVDDVALGATR